MIDISSSEEPETEFGENLLQNPSMIDDNDNNNNEAEDVMEDVALGISEFIDMYNILLWLYIIIIYL